MLLARLLDRKISLIHRAVALRAESHLLFERKPLEHLHDFFFGGIVESGIDAMPVEDREANLVKRVAEVAREGRRAHVAGADLELLVELLPRILGQVVT